MENSLLKAKYPTKEIMQKALNNEKRINKIETCMGEYSDHIRRHTDIIEPKLNRLDIVMFGEQGDDGAIRELHRLSDMDERLIKIETTINKLAWLIVLAVAGALLKLVIIG